MAGPRARLLLREYRRSIPCRRRRQEASGAIGVKHERSNWGQSNWGQTWTIDNLGQPQDGCRNVNKVRTANANRQHFRVFAAEFLALTVRTGPGRTPGTPRSGLVPVPPGKRFPIGPPRWYSSSRSWREYPKAEFSVPSAASPWAFFAWHWCTVPQSLCTVATHGGYVSSIFRAHRSPD